ncbi:MAG: hypothetical protein MZV70_07100 [Desulfobacterales bacterium]|nr:hypothetical protein [Desulfobacterales bacterium]
MPLITGALDAGLHIAHYFLLGGPGENKQTLQETLTGLDRLEQAVFSSFAASAFTRTPPCMMSPCRKVRLPPDKIFCRLYFTARAHITVEEIMQTVENHANGRLNWIIGAGEAKATRVLPKLYRTGIYRAFVGVPDSVKTSLQVSMT